MEEKVHTREGEERKEREKARARRTHVVEECVSSIYSFIQQILFDCLLCASHSGGHMQRTERTSAYFHETHLPNNSN